MTDHKVKSLDGLILGIKQLLLESRCSFSDEERVLLNGCFFALQEFKNSNENSGNPNLSFAIEAMEILVKVFIITDHFKSIF